MRSAIYPLAMKPKSISVRGSENETVSSFIVTFSYPTWDNASCKSFGAGTEASESEEKSHNSVTGPIVGSALPSERAA